ncbi:hypothetical protein ACRYCC_30720 [Actinomadura scrupuli]|uniref:hypothetical protein n=1 Tax=Actinomadura scrupuli TaxID=559629 RepID=UPI003D999317
MVLLVFSLMFLAPGGQLRREISVVAHRQGLGEVGRQLLVGQVTASGVGTT